MWKAQVGEVRCRQKKKKKLSYPVKKLGRLQKVFSTNAYPESLAIDKCLDLIKEIVIEFLLGAIRIGGSWSWVHFE
jgi:hypothetical protein